MDNGDTDHRPNGWVETILSVVIGLPLHLAGRAADVAASSFERTEFAFANLSDRVGELAAMWSRFLSRPLEAIGQILAFPFFLALSLAQKASSVLFDRSEWIVGQTAFAAVEFFAMLAKVLFWIPFQIADVILALVWRGPIGALICWTVRKAIPQSMLDALPRFESITDVALSTYAVCSEFFIDWWLSRDITKAAMALPAVMLGVATGAGMLLAFSDSDSEKIQRYRASLSQAIQTDDEATSELTLAKLGRLGYRKHDAETFRAALAKEHSLGVAEVVGQMEQLLLSEEGAFGPAQIWMAYHLLGGTPIGDRHDALLRAESLVNDYVATEGHNADTRVLMSEILVRRDSVAAGIVQLQTVEEQNRFDVAARLMQMHRSINNIEESKLQANRAVELFTEQQTQGYEFTAEQHFQLVDALGTCARWQEMLSTLTVIDRQFKSETTTTWQRAADQERAQLAQHLVQAGVPNTNEFSVKIHRFGWNNPTINNRLAVALANHDTTVRNFINTQKTKQHVHPELFRLAGDSRLQEEDLAEALAFYEEAFEVDPADARASNNVAWLHLQANRLDDALNAADRTVALSDRPNYLETRGQILAKLRRYRDSIRDLERALNGQLNNPSSAHATLADMYESVGETERAEMHRSRSLTTQKR